MPGVAQCHASKHASGLPFADQLPAHELCTQGPDTLVLQMQEAAGPKCIIVKSGHQRQPPA